MSIIKVFTPDTCPLKKKYYYYYGVSDIPVLVSCIIIIMLIQDQHYN